MTPARRRACSWVAISRHYEKTHCRISIGTMDEMKRAVEVFKKVLGNTTTTAAAKDGR